MATWLGAFVGGLLIIALVAMLVEKAIFQRLFDDPVVGKLSSVAAGWLAVSTVAGFGMADGGPFAALAYLIYLPPAVAVAIWFYRRGLALRELMAEQAQQPTSE